MSSAANQAQHNEQFTCSGPLVVPLVGSRELCYTCSKNKGKGHVGGRMLYEKAHDHLLAVDEGEEDM